MLQVLRLLLYSRFYSPDIVIRMLDTCIHAGMYTIFAISSAATSYRVVL